MHNHFQRSPENPYHISIGGVIRNEEGKVACHYFNKKFHPAVGEIENLYLLMRETIEPNESIEACLARGCMEEFGMETSLVSYLGSIVARFKHRDVAVEKTTLYFLCDLVSFDPNKRREGDPEGDSEILWLEPAFIIEKIKEQGTRLGREDVDESKVLERLVG